MSLLAPPQFQLSSIKYAFTTARNDDYYYITEAEKIVKIVLQLISFNYYVLDASFSNHEINSITADYRKAPVGGCCELL